METCCQGTCRARGPVALYIFSENDQCNSWTLLLYMFLECRLCTRRGAYLCASSGTLAASRTRVCLSVILAGYA